MQSIEPKSQMLIIWKALCKYLEVKMKGGQSVNVRKFGAFTFDIQTELPKIGSRRYSMQTTYAEAMGQRKHIHKMRPCFVVDPTLQTHLIRYKGKEEISPAASQRSTF